MKSQSASVAQKEKFLDQKATVTEISQDKALLTDDCDITSDDEVWLVQCPKTINIKNLNGRKIKIPGKTHHDEVESVAEEFSAVQNISLGVSSNRGFTIKSIPIQGRVLVRERLKTTKVDEVDSSATSKKAHRVPFPDGLKKRHPLHGYDYKKQIEISDLIAARLKDRGPVVNVEKKKISLGRKNTKVVSIKSEKEAENELDDVEFINEVTIKNEKTRKRKRDDSTSESDKKKRKKGTTDDEHMDLAWIKEF